ncbi:MAG: glycine zipper 2TM domain-containing protein [Robiginitomaculum sp.]|nr:glycine zipper 2TM domain-containing protein [Robiginitomaculum sp.]
MKMLTTLRAATIKAIAGATLAGAAISLPALAQATDYNSGYYDPGQKCRSQENDAQLIGGLLGAVVGGVTGSQVSGNGARTEGSVIGAVLGGLAGAAIGDESVDCDKKRNRRFNTAYSGQTYGRRTPVVYDRTVTTRRIYQPNGVYRNNDYRNSNRRYQNNGYRNNEYNNAGYNYGGYNQRSGLRAQIEDVRYRLQDLRQEDRWLKREMRRGYSQRLERRWDRVCNEIERLERKQHRLKKRLRKQNRNRH